MSPVGLGVELKVMFFLPEEAADAFTGAAFFSDAAFFGAALFTARVAERDVVARSTDTGAKAVAPAKMDARTASFMVVVMEGKDIIFLLLRGVSIQLQREGCVLCVRVWIWFNLLTANVTQQAAKYLEYTCKEEWLKRSSRWLTLVCP